MKIAATLKVRHAGSPLRLPGMCSKVAMRSRCSGVSGGNESTTVWTCWARTMARSGIVGSLMLGGACAVRAAASGGVAAVRVSCLRRYPVLLRLIGRCQLGEARLRLG